MACGCQKQAQFKVLAADGTEVFAGAQVAARAVRDKRYPDGTLQDPDGNVVAGPDPTPAEPAPVAGP